MSMVRVAFSDAGTAGADSFCRCSDCVYASGCRISGCEKRHFDDAQSLYSSEADAFFICMLFTNALILDYRTGA